MLDFNIKDLETRGFLVVKNFLNKADIDRLLVDYNMQRDRSSDVVKLKDQTVLKSGIHDLEYKIVPLVNLINQHTKLQIDLIGPTGMYFDTKLVKLMWHQDHESYYTWQTGYHQVNFWMPLIKPDANTSGIKVVPMDRLRSKIGELFDQRILDQGAKRFQPSVDITHVVDDETGDKFDLPINIDSIAESPSLIPGDLLMIRGDVIHATQDNLNHRVTVAVRTVDGSRYVTKQRFQNQCEFKKHLLDANFWSTKKITDQFNKGVEQILIHDLYKGRITVDNKILK